MSSSNPSKSSDLRTSQHLVKVPYCKPEYGGPKGSWHNYNCLQIKQVLVSELCQWNYWQKTQKEMCTSKNVCSQNNKKYDNIKKLSYHIVLSMKSFRCSVLLIELKRYNVCILKRNTCETVIIAKSDPPVQWQQIMNLWT